jgi:hypothetical protein
MMRENTLTNIYHSAKETKQKNTKYANGTKFVMGIVFFFTIDRKYCFDTAKDFGFKSMSYIYNKRNLGTSSWKIDRKKGVTKKETCYHIGTGKKR